MAIKNRTVTIKDIFAKNANTTIPNPPVVGTSYRNENLTAAEVGEGWPFKEIVDSAKFNEAMYEYTTICKLLETYGFLPWSANTDYQAGSLCLGTDRVIYQAKRATGPSTTAKDPVTDTNHTYWQDFVGSNYVDLTSTQTISGGKTFTKNISISKDLPVLTLQATDVTKGTAPAESKAWVVAMVDSKGTAVANRLMAVGNVLSNNNNNACFIRAYKNASGSTDAADVGVVYPASGNPFAYAPASDAIDSIVTTTGINKAKNGYVKFGNGLIIQWGITSSSSYYSATYPIPFSSGTSYTIVLDQKRTQYGQTGVNSTTPTGFTAGSNAGVPLFWIAIGY